MRSVKRLVLLLACIIWLASQSHAAIANVQTANSARISSASSFAITATVIHHLLVVTINFDSGTATVSSVACTPSCGTWVQVPSCLAHSTTAGESTDVWYIADSSASGDNPKVTLSAAVQYQAAFYEYSGTNLSTALDGTCQTIANHAAAANPSGPAITTTVTGSVVLTTLVTATNVTAVAGGFTMDFIDDSGGGHARDLGVAIGTYTPTWTMTSGAYAGATVAFQVAASASTATPHAGWTF